MKSFAIAGVFGLQGSATAAGSKERSSERTVPMGTARKAAEAKIGDVAGSPKFESWEGCRAGRGSTLHLKNADAGPDYLPSAYIFPVVKNGKTMGYVTAAARTDWVPILEFSPATPPTDLVDSTVKNARQQGFSPTGRLLYHGGVKYGLELEGGNVMNVRNGKLEAVTGVSPRDKSFKPNRVRKEWERVESGSGESTSGSVEIMNHYDWVYGVPAWTEHDDGGGSRTYYGSGSDEWIKWDGCTPIAGSMVIAYHEGYTEDDTWYREYVIDRLHDTMNTGDNDGATWPWNIDDGIDNYTWGSNDYNGRNIYTWTYPNFEKQEINNNRPFLLNMDNGGSAEDKSKDYNDHSVTVVGYKDNAEYLEIHDTWDDSYHYFAWGNWSSCMYTKVTTS